ncbi:MAG TPA: lipopolysaccharide biosynthesis protein [Burkholderiaceae bacterium]|nr:lipopolysaccharide biosynthesis protein [Burkholderiaceae bacterium]
MSSPLSAVGAKIASGAALMLLLKMLERMIGVASMFVLARLLAPADFGLVAIATSVYALLELLGAFGLDVVLIRARDPDREMYDTAWTINLLFYLLCGFALVAGAPFAAHYFSEPRLVLVMQLLALAAAFQGIENIGIVAFRKDLNFGKDFTLTIAKRLITTVTVIVLAYTLRSYLALAIGIVLGRALGAALSYAMHPFRPRLTLSRWREMLGVSGWLLANNYLSFAIDHGPRIALGKLVGPAAVGVYTLAHEITTMVINEFVAAINRAALPGYAHVSGNAEALRREVTNVLAAIGLIVFPAAVGLACVADIALPVLLGEKWAGAAPLLQVLAFAGMLRALQSNIGAAYLVRGKPQRITTLLGIQVAVLALAFGVLFKEHGAMAVAIGHVSAAAILLPLNFVIVRSEIGFTTRMAAVALARPALAALVMGIALRVVVPQTPLNRGGTWTTLLIEIVVGALCYFASVAALWWMAGKPEGPERMVLLRVRAMLNRLRRHAST